jgi:hypothetical protein
MEAWPIEGGPFKTIVLLTNVISIPQQMLSGPISFPSPSIAHNARDSSGHPPMFSALTSEWADYDYPQNVFLDMIGFVLR